MREYRIGEEIAWRPVPDGPLVWSKVADVRPASGGAVEYYWVRVEGKWDRDLVKVHPTQIADLASVSAQASAALDRIHRQDRAKADLLDYLLGTLSAYADMSGEIRYTVAPTTAEGKPRRASHNLRKLVDAYMVKRDATYEER